MACLIDAHLSTATEESEIISRLLRRVLTALIHHCSTAEQFSPISELVIGRFMKIINEKEKIDSNVDQLRKTLDLVVVICTVRKGSRLSRKPFLHHFYKTDLTSCLIRFAVTQIAGSSGECEGAA